MICLSSENGWAGGKKPGNVNQPSGPTLTTPNPVRDVLVLPVSTTLFNLPNGSTVNLTTELNSLVNTSVTQSTQFQPTDGSLKSSCQSHLELRSAVTVFEMNMVELGVNFGYSPAGSIPVPVQVEGKANVKVGVIAMDFSLWKCTGGQCVSVAAATANQLKSGVQLSFELDFAMVRTGTNLIYNTPLGNAIRAIMVDGINELSRSTRVNELPWQAEVKYFDSQEGTLIFDVGSHDRVEPFQTFEVYAPVDSSSSGMCDVFQVVGYIHTTRVDAVSSTAEVDQVFGSRGIQPGDIVMIRVKK